MPEIEDHGPPSHLQLRSSLSTANSSDRLAASLEKDRISRKKSNGTTYGNGFLGSTKEGNKTEIGSHLLPPISGTGARNNKLKASKRRGILTHDLESVDGSPSTTNNCRYDSSLSLLTKKFLNLLQQAEDGTLDLNRAAEILDVQKRRIYDITNVLEGVGLIEKKLKNMIRWKVNGMSRPKELNDHIAELKVEIEMLYEDERSIDDMIRQMQESLKAMTEDERNKKRLFVTKEDINSLPCFKDSTLIAIKAPHGTSVEVPDPVEEPDYSQHCYQLLLRSTLGPIHCYLISKHKEMDEDPCSMQQPAPIGSAENSCNYARDDKLKQDLVSSNSINSENSCDGLVRISPSEDDMDADYMLLSEPSFSVADAWTG